MIALYLRLSMSDGDLGKDGKDESNSIENQRMMLEDFVERRKDLTGEIIEYVDDGYSGTNFDRPAFKRLIEDMKKGQIDVLLTKDLSRLGRNYIEVGDYIEQIFPLLGVRYIAVYSHYDSNEYIGTGGDLEMEIMNLVNSLYSKDLSKKGRSARITRWKNGKATSGIPPYGYVKDQKEKGKWIIEPEAAAVVRKIFDLILEGRNTSQVVTVLNEEKIPTAGQYRIKHGKKKVHHTIKEEEWMWDRGKVNYILNCYEYTGALVQGKRRVISTGSKRTRKVDEAEQYITEGHHEAIVTKEEFKKAQGMVRRPKMGPAVNIPDCPIAKKIYCGNCNRKMTLITTVEKKVQCSHRKVAGKTASCPADEYPISDIEYLVRRALKNQLLLMEQLDGQIKIRYEAETAAHRDEVKKLFRTVDLLKGEKIRLYESYAEGHLTREEYTAKKNNLAEEQRKAETRLDEMTHRAATQERLCRESDRYIDLAADLYDPYGMTKEMADAFLERINIYDKDHVEIIFAFRDLLKEMAEEAGGQPPEESQPIEKEGSDINQEPKKKGAKVS